MPAALWWAVPAALALTVLTIRAPRGYRTVLLLDAASAWTALIIAALPLLLRS
ncbi:hypothetical protein [Kitasatospora sp. NPDC087314]|uniref:hypothetical protein n=1 Tax=Kitasatospora sp. NPDC087314 TaxID=3364068 RepID=UPI0037F6EF67